MLRRNGDKIDKPLHKEKRFQTTTGKKSAIRFKETIFGKQIILSNGRGSKPLEIEFPRTVSQTFGNAAQRREGSDGLYMNIVNHRLLDGMPDDGFVGYHR